MNGAFDSKILAYIAQISSLTLVWVHAFRDDFNINAVAGHGNPFNAQGQYDLAVYPVVGERYTNTSHTTLKIASWH